VAEDGENDETDDEEDLPDFDSSPSLSVGDKVSLLTSIADFRSDVPNAKEDSDFLSFLTELERVDSD
jgi:F0F1-type ATP synthase delta subunit